MARIEEQCLHREAEDIAPSAIGLGIAFGEADPPLLNALRWNALSLGTPQQYEGGSTRWQDNCAPAA
jgi:hypothetical protein